MAQPTGKVTLIDGDGNVITTLDIDASGQASYTETITSDDVGRRTVTARYTGDDDYAAFGEDSFTIEVTDENGNGGANSKATHVIKIIAGPGIYISPTNGKGTVTISTRPINNPVGNFNQVKWCLTESEKNGDLAAFMAVGTNGLVMMSDDAENWNNTGPVNTLGTNNTTVTFQNVHIFQSNTFDDDGVAYWNLAAVTFNDGPPSTDCHGIAWGRMGYTNSSGVVRGDNIDKLSDEFLYDGALQAGDDSRYSESFYQEGDSLDNLLTILFTIGGSAYSIPGLPLSFTAGGSGGPQPGRIDYYLETSAELGNVQRATSDIIDNGSGSFYVKAVNDGGYIWSSTRSGNSESTWDQEYVSNNPLYGIGYGAGTWIAVGDNDTIVIDNGGGWSETNTGLITGLWQDACYGNGTWVLCGVGGALATSTDDGATWEIADSGTTENLNSIAYSPQRNLFAVVGDNNATVAIRG